MEDGSKITCSVNHKFPIKGSPSLRGGEVDPTTHMMMLPASDLKVGDRICSADLGGLRHLPSNVLGYPDLHHAFVRKIKHVKCESPVPVYCLTVPLYHNFMLFNGVFSSNCHINCLLLGLLYKFLPDLFTRGMVYVADTPEFYAIDKSDKPYFGRKADDVAAQLAKANVKADVMHIKGYGEVSAKILRILAFDPVSYTHLTLPTTSRV